MVTRRGRHAFTLVELLIVVFIITLILQLALPAVLRSREAALKTSCGNNLRQLALGMQLHNVAHGHYPTGGWGWSWIGEPERGFDQGQPGGWQFNILPFIEQEQIRTMTAGLTGEKRAQVALEMVAIPLPVFHCPSRRLAKAYPIHIRYEYTNIPTPERWARSDYAANGGDIPYSTFSMAGKFPSGPRSYEEADAWIQGTEEDKSWNMTEFGGIMAQRSMIRSAQITDGSSNTFLVGEKYLPTARYKDGSDYGDNEGLYIGYDADNVRSVSREAPPVIDSTPYAFDIRQLNDMHRFGSIHSESFNMAYCDGTVRVVSYDIDPKVYLALGVRNDEEITSGR